MSYTIEGFDYQMHMENEENRILLAPPGFAVEERSNGLCLLCDDSAIEWHIAVIEQIHGIRETEENGEHLVEIGYRHDLEKDGVAERGRSSDRFEAYRYALGCHYASYEDPVLKEKGVPISFKDMTISDL